MATTIRPIQYGLHVTKNLVTERVIEFLEDEKNDDQPLPKDLFQGSDIDEVNEKGRRGYAEHLRFLLLGGGCPVS